MITSIFFLASLLVAVAAQDQPAAGGAGQTRYGGRPNRFQTGLPHGGAGGFGGGIGNQGFGGGIGGHPGGFGGGIGLQGGFPGQGFGPGVGGQFGPGIVNPGVGGGLIGTTHTDGALAYNCAATASQGQFGIDATCEKWCKTPQQYWGGKYVCCDDRPAFCPPVRSECPKFGGLGPVCCFVDSQCQIPTDKCCYDTCLGHKVCKPATKQGF
ncbi:antimicrobial peptide [Hyalella azteca]|uniref:Antimicrobial peptide n=1 Tax=Hyalella azteca TaxID=294128 RepID=A0A6A0H965_HYAAZ|nr:glycine-rich cell wall structural protein 1-like [Hyalella azteca]KAA0201545.1 antimicrobial peptide [Hyalella azteca]